MLKNIFSTCMRYDKFLTCTKVENCASETFGKLTRFSGYLHMYRYKHTYVGLKKEENGKTISLKCQVKSLKSVTLYLEK